VVPDEGGIDVSAVALPISGDRADLAAYVSAANAYPKQIAPAKTRTIYRQVTKRCFDALLSGLLILLLSPIFVAIAVGIYLADGRPIFFLQSRIGRRGRPFLLIKFRTMVRDAEAELENWKHKNPGLWHQYRSNNFKISNDPRLHCIGGFLRRYSLDELPQLWNVFVGEMSLVGPRPLLSKELPFYDADVRLYQSVRPGITGIWQVSGRSATTFSERARMDAAYVTNFTFASDCRLLLRTVPCVLTGRGAY